VEGYRTLIVDYKDYQDDIRSIRNEVFIWEQNVPEAIEFDGKDAESTFALALAESGEAIGTGRLSQTGKIGRLAVRKTHRNTGIGTLILETLENEARNQGLEQVFLHGQVHAIDFYKKRGYLEKGQTFTEAGIEHLYMYKFFDV